MKNWYGKLKESDNYNVIIPAMLCAITVTFVWSVVVAVNNIRQVVLWDMTDAVGAVLIVLSVLSLIFMIIAAYFVIQACKRDPKFMICAAACLAVVAVTGVFAAPLICIAAGAVWFFSVGKKGNKRWEIVIKTVAAMLITIMAVFLLRWMIMAFSINAMYGWGSDSLEEGDWSEWETEEDSGDFQYYDEEGNGTTMQTFEFE